MAYNKREVLEKNINIIELVLSGKELTKEDRVLIREFKGFGGIKSVLLPPQAPHLFPKADQNLVPLVQQLHDVLKKYSSDIKEYEHYFSSIKNSVLTSFYTPQPIVAAIRKSLEGIVPFDSILEPSAGAGVFLDEFKARQRTAIEKDPLTGKILQALYPDDEIMIRGFQTIPLVKENSYDMVISNIPFGNFPIFDPAYANRKDNDRKKATGAIHNYFFVKGMDMLKEGGVLAFITSSGVMDSKGNEFLRKALLKESNLISAVRLPNNLFANTGGIEVRSDLIILQKDQNRAKSLSPEEKLFIKSGELINDYYSNMSHIIHTKGDFDKNQFGKVQANYYHEGGEQAIADDLLKIVSSDIGKNYKKGLLKREDPEVEIQRVSSAKRKKTESNQLQFSLFEDVAFFAETFEQNISQEPTKEQLAFDKYMQLKDAYFNLRDTEQERNIVMPGLRVELNEIYDSFVQEYGNLRLLDNYLIEQDEHIKEIKGIEKIENKEILKSDIFFEPVNIRQVKDDLSIIDALSACLNEVNYVDLKYISELSGIAEDDIKKELLGNQIYFNPIAGEYECSSLFLSGNIVSKIEKLKEYNSVLEIYHDPQTENFNDIRKEINLSIQALEDVRPERIPLEEIGLNLGERWIPERYYTQFSKHLFNPPGTDERHKNYVEVKYLEGSDDFALKQVNNSNSMSYATEKYGVQTANRYYRPDAVLRFAMLDAMPSMTKTIEREGQEVKVPDKEGIQKMNAAIEEIRNSFGEWVNSIHQQNKEELEAIYNDKFNNIVKPVFDGGFQTFPDLNYENLGIQELYSTQKDAILMLKQNGGGIIDHEVGGGKTLIQCVAAYEMKRLGTVSKPMILGLKANIHEIAATYKSAYPHARVLYPSKEELKNDNIDTFLSKIQNNNWDAIIMSHEQFEKIPQANDIIKAITQEELEKVEEAIITLADFDSESEERQAYKYLERKKESLLAQIEGVNFKIGQRKNENVIDFRTMGIDHIFVDESHKYKNLGFTTKHTRAAGLGDPKGAQRARNMLHAIRTIQEKTGKDLGATFLSGTTISNSLTELYNIFNYLRPNALREQGIFSFDGWLATYAVKSKEFEFSVTNDIIQKERFRHFCKVPELASFYSEITDFKTAEMIGIDRPQINEMLVRLDQTPDQEDMYERLKVFAKQPKGELIYRGPLSESEEKAKMLIATNAAKNAALDMRLIDPKMFEDHEGNKINACVNRILDYYKEYDQHKGTQFVFSDLGTFDKKKEWDVYSEIKNKLIDKGIPEHEIQFIQNFKTDKKKIQFQQAMNEGTIRVGIGSTEMLGTGVNAQQRAIAVHHLDIPWTPKDFIQRNGRAGRKGNWVAKEHAGNKVDTFIYAVEKTLDVYKFNLQATKHKFITQIKSQDINVRTLDEGGGDDKTGMNYNEYIAILSGDTSLLEKAKLERRIAQLKSEEKTFDNKIRDRDRFIREIKSKIDVNKEAIIKLSQDLERYKNIPRDENGNVIMKVQLVIPSIKDDKVYLMDNPPTKVYETVKDTGIALNSIAEVINAKPNENEKVGEFYGFNIAIRQSDSWTKENKFSVYSDNELHYKHNNGSMPRTPERAGEFIMNALDKIENMLETHKIKDKSLNEELAGLMAVTDTKYPKKEEIRAMETELKEIIKKVENNIEKEVSEQHMTV